MVCPNTALRVPAYLAETLSPELQAEFTEHLALCSDCRQEVAGMRDAQASLLVWRDEPLPDWGAAASRSVRGLAAARPTASAERKGFASSWWQWLPSAVSLAMLVLLLVDTRVTTGEQGLSLALGDSAQRAEVEALIANFEQRQSENDLALVQAVLARSREESEASLQQLFAYFEEQRAQDLEAVRVSYEQLMNSDYETVRSLQQLATIVAYSEPGN